MPVHEDGAWHETPVTHIVPLWTRRPRHALYLSFHLTQDGFNGCGIVFPIVGKGEDRVRLFLHAHNTKDDVVRLVRSITTWIQEMLDIEASGDKATLPTAARLAFDLIEKDKLIANGVDGINGTNGVNGANGANGLNGANGSLNGITAGKIAPLVSGIDRLEIEPIVV